MAKKHTTNQPEEAVIEAPEVLIDASEEFSEELEVAEVIELKFVLNRNVSHDGTLYEKGTNCPQDKVPYFQRKEWLDPLV